MKPFKDLVVIEVDPPKEKTASGLYIKEDWKTIPPTGVIKEVGPDVTTVAVGDKVLFERYSSIIIDKTTRMCKESHILARFTDGQTA